MDSPAFFVQTEHIAGERGKNAARTQEEHRKNVARTREERGKNSGKNVGTT